MVSGGQVAGPGVEEAPPVSPAQPPSSAAERGRLDWARSQASAGGQGRGGGRQQSLRLPGMGLGSEEARRAGGRLTEPGSQAPAGL